MTLPLTEKYRAKLFEDLIGIDTAIADIKTFLKTFPKKRALILNGPVGTGKTSMAIALAKENNLANPGLIAVGQELQIPDTEPKELTETVSAEEYTVQEGDWLSKIALSAYGDMFAWEKIYEANKDVIGANPDLIEPGMVLTIPR